MARLLTILFALSLGYAGLVASPAPFRTLATPDGFAATPLWLRMDADGNIWHRGERVASDGEEANALGLASAMSKASLAISKAKRDAMLEPDVHPRLDHLFEGWLRVAIDPDAPFAKVWGLFLGPRKDHSIHKYALEFPDGRGRVFVRMPWDFGVHSSKDPEERRLWLIQWLERGEFGYEYEGVRHALGTELGFDQLAIDSYHATASEALTQCMQEKPPGLLVEADVPWREVASALNALARGGIAWWPVPVEKPGFARMTWEHDYYIEVWREQTLR